jgi:hypothetical protein
LESAEFVAKELVLEIVHTRGKTCHQKQFVPRTSGMKLVAVMM